MGGRRFRPTVCGIPVEVTLTERRHMRRPDGKGDRGEAGAGLATEATMDREELLARIFVDPNVCFGPAPPRCRSRSSWP
jgi:hypothetical protein